jgi:hypothetical protein
MIEFIHCSSQEILFEIAQCWKDIEPFKIIFENLEFVIIGFRDEQIAVAVKDTKVEMLRTVCVVLVLTNSYFRENMTLKVGPQP